VRSNKQSCTALDKHGPIANALAAPQRCPSFRCERFNIDVNSDKSLHLLGGSILIRLYWQLYVFIRSSARLLPFLFLYQPHLVTSAFGRKPTTGECHWQPRRTPIKGFSVNCSYFSERATLPPCVKANNENRLPGGHDKSELFGGQPASSYKLAKNSIIDRRKANSTRTTKVFTVIPHESLSMNPQ